MMTPMGDQKFTCKREKCKGVLTPIGSVRSHIDSLAKARQRASEASQKGIKLTHGCCLSCEYVTFSFSLNFQFFPFFETLSLYLSHSITYTHKKRTNLEKRSRNEHTHEKHEHNTHETNSSNKTVNAEIVLYQKQRMQRRILKVR